MSRVRTKNITFDSPIVLPTYTLATAPSASSAGSGAVILITDAPGGAVPAFSNGTNWLSAKDESILI